MEPTESCAPRQNRHYVKLPFQVQDQVGEIQIEQWVVDGEILSPKLAQAFIELVVSQVIQSSFPDPQTYKNQVIANLLKGKISEGKVAWQQAHQLGIDLTPPRAVILIDAADFIPSPGHDSFLSRLDQQHCSRSIINSIVTFFNLPNDTICADLGGGEFAVIKASDTRNLSPWAAHALTTADVLSPSWTNLDALKRAGNALLARLREETATPLSVGIGRYHPGILGLARSYEDARVALRLGRQFNGQNRVYCLDDLGIAAFACVADERTKVELALHLLSPLDNEPDLIQTLNVFFAENCALSATARRLCIHRNTLTYRLEKIASLTGLDPRHFDEAVQIRLALLLQEFKGP
jgi:carbohydrate diacid regulator